MDVSDIFIFISIAFVHGKTKMLEKWDVFQSYAVIPHMGVKGYSYFGYKDLCLKCIEMDVSEILMHISIVFLNMLNQNC